VSNHVVDLADLLLPILLSAVAVFVISSVIHMALPFHKADYQPLPNEAAVLEGMRTHGVVPGHFAFPCPGSMKEMASPEMLAKYQQGPVGFMTVMPSGPPAMGKNLTMWFVYSLVVGVFVAYIGTLSLDAGESAMRVFRVTGAVAVLPYALSYFMDVIWKGMSFGIALKFMIDGVIYGLATAAVFAWLWPAAV